MIFFLVYNLHLLDLGFDEALIGRVAAAFTLGSLAVTFLTGWLLNNYGLNRVIQLWVLATAILLPLRSLTHAAWFVIIAAFLNGASIGGWMVSAPPFLTRNANLEIRAWAFSLSYGSSIGMGALAGVIVGLASRQFPDWIGAGVTAGFSGKQYVLLASSASVLVGFLVLLFLRESAASAGAPEPPIPSIGSAKRRIWSRRFVLQLLIVLVLWSLFVGSFPPFFNVYFHKQFNQSLQGIGMIFSFSQLCQVLAVLCMPWLALRLGRVRAIFSMQIASALVLPALIFTSNVQLAGMVYLAYLSFQVMTEPALENFIMDSVLPEERNTVASLRYMTLFAIQALAVLVSGFVIAHFGYSFLLVGIAILGISAALTFYLFFRSRAQVHAAKESTVPAACPLN